MDFREPNPTEFSMEWQVDRRPGRKLNKRQLDDVTTKDALENVRYVRKAGINPEAILTPLFTFTVCGEDPTRKYTDPNYEEPERTSKSKTGDDDAVEERSRVRDDSTSAEEKESEDASGAGASNNMHLELRSSHEENDSHEDQHELKKESANDAAVGAGERPFEQGMKPPESSELTDRSLYGADGAKPKLSPISKDSRAETDSGESESSTKANGKSPLVSTYKPPSKDFQPHEGAVRDKSAKFAAMAEIEFIETRHRRSVVDDSDVDTFQLFAEFVYSGTYTDPGVKQTMDDNRKNIQTSVPARPRRTKRETRTYGRGSYMRGLHGIGRPRGGGRIRGRGRGAFANTFGGMGFAMTGGPGQDPAASSGDEAAAVAENKEAVAAIDADPNPFAGRDEYNAWYETGAIGYLRPAALLESFKKCLEKHAKARQPSVLRLHEQARDMLPVFLAHAKLYDLADKWIVRDLKDLVLAKVHALLMEYDPIEDGFDTIPKLIEYVFAKLPEVGRFGEVEPFRALLVHYCLVKLEDIGQDHKWDELVERGGEFACMLIDGFRTTHIGPLRNTTSDQAETAPRW